jgi:WD40 repeat protein
MGVAFNHTGRIVTTAGADDTVAFSDLSGEPFSRPMRTSQGQVMTVAFSPDEQLLATGGDDGTVKLWTSSGAEAGKLIGHQGEVLHVGFTSDGQLIATSSSDGTVRLWLRNGEQLTQYEGYRGFLAEEALGGSFGTTGVSLSPDGRIIAIAESAGRVQIWHVQTLGELMEQACTWLERSNPTSPAIRMRRACAVAASNNVPQKVRVMGSPPLGTGRSWICSPMKGHCGTALPSEVSEYSQRVDWSEARKERVVPIDNLLDDVRRPTFALAQLRHRV